MSIFEGYGAFNLAQLFPFAGHASSVSRNCKLMVPFYLKNLVPILLTAWYEVRNKVTAGVIFSEEKLRDVQVFCLFSFVILASCCTSFYYLKKPEYKFTSMSEVGKLWNWQVRGSLGTLAFQDELIVKMFQLVVHFYLN